MTCPGPVIACKRILLLCPVPLHCALLLFALLAPASALGEETAAVTLQPLPAGLPRHFGVIGIRLQGSGDDLQITHVRVGSPADRAGLQIGDRLRGADGYRLATLQETLDYMQSHKAGATVTLHLVREGRALELTCQVTDRRHLYGLMIEAGAPPPGLQSRHNEWLSQANTARQTIDNLLMELDATAALDSLRRALEADLSAYGHDGRLADVDFTLRHPSAAALPVVRLADGLMRRRVNGGLTTADRLELMATRLIQQEVASDTLAQVTDTDTVFAQLVDSPLYAPLLRSLWHTGQLVTRSLPVAQPETDLLAGVAALIDRFDTSFYLDEGDREETLQHTQILRWAKQVDLKLMAQAAARMAALSEPTALRSIRKAAGKMPAHIDDQLPAAFSGDIRYARHTPWGWLIIGGKGRTVYGQDAACIIDLGGDDHYLGGGRVAATFGRPLGLIIDLDGDDRYIDRRHVGVAAAIAGVAAIIDVAGDDLYEGTMMAQAAAFAGAALLVDRAGDDVYLGDLLAQGTAMFGLALLLDEKGADLYSAAQFAQGFGGPSAIAALVDEGGSDRYIADRSRPSSYGTADIYNGWAQGVGCGLRGFAAGGLGLLVDAAGDDEYQGGNFSQGVGYFFGLGGLVDGAGHDHYRATRYSQGSAAHQATGVLIDDAGNDVYTGRIAANQGAAWDASVAILIDRAGNDSYSGAGLAQGAAAMNGFAVLFDGNGHDSYQSPSGQADGGSTQYWGGRNAPNLGILIDTGGRDTYDRDGRTNGARWRQPRYGLFHDLE